MSRALLALTLALAALSAPTAARAGTVPVTIRFAEFAPNIVDVLPLDRGLAGVSEGRTGHGRRQSVRLGELGPKSPSQLPSTSSGCTSITARSTCSGGEIGAARSHARALPPVACHSASALLCGPHGGHAHPVRVDGSRAPGPAPSRRRTRVTARAVIPPPRAATYRAASAWDRRDAPPLRLR
jgi:hypothetical protein